MTTLGIGLNELHNKVHSPDESSRFVIDVRETYEALNLQLFRLYEMDVTAAYNFHETKQGVRWTVDATSRTNILDKLLVLNHQRYAEEVSSGHHDKKGIGKNRSKTPTTLVDQAQELNLDFGPTKSPEPKSAKETDSTRVIGRASSDIGPTELLNAIFTCTARRESTDREELTREVAAALGFQRLREKTRDLIASGFNSAIRRGLISHEGTFIVRLATTYADLDLDTLVKAIAAIVRPGRVYTPDEVFHNAADHLGCKRLGEPFRVSLQSALNAASRRGIITKRGEEISRAN